MRIIKVPKNLTLKNALNFCTDLWDTEHSGEYHIDFKALNFVEPFTMSLIANELKRFRNTKLESKFKAINHRDKQYPAHMGFFKSFGLNFGNDPGEAPGNSRYIPITILEVSKLEYEANQSYSHVGDVIEAKSQEIAKLLTQQDSGDLVDTLTFSIREIMRNVVEHSKSEVIEYSAQFWPTKHLVEVAILDSGTGIKEGLSSNPYVKVDSERDAINFALLPGISGKMYKGIKKRRDDDWQNSGFGLYMTSRICRNGGSFLVISNNQCLILDGETKENLDCSFKGTGLRMRIDTSKITHYKGMLEKYREDGQIAAQKISGKDAIEASLASTMLARDFQ